MAEAAVTSPSEPERYAHAAGHAWIPLALIRELSLAAGVRRLDLPIFGEDQRVEQALEITEVEKATIQNAWDAAVDRVRGVEAATMKSEEIDEWSVRITVPDAAPTMAGIASDFRARVGQALGGDRAAAFLAAKQVDAVFTPPEGERTVMVTTEEIGDGRWRYRMDLEGPQGSRVWVGETLPDEIRHLTDAAGIVPALAKEATD